MDGRRTAERSRGRRRGAAMRIRAGGDAALMIQAAVFVFVLLLTVPTLIGFVFGSRDAREGEGLPEEEEKEGLETPQTVSVWISDEGKAEEIVFEDYVAAVTASEMPSSFDSEALKAQSVAARTYAMAKILKYDEKHPEAHPKAPLCDSTHCQAYKSEEALIALHAEGWEQEGWKKIREACEATRGEMLYYGGELVMQPLFFSSSGGQTENSEDVFTGAYPYLVSVASPYEENASHRNEEKTFTLSELREKLESAYADRAVGPLTASDVKILGRTAGGRVSTIRVGASVFKGTEVRNALDLSSALFSLGFSADGGSITFTSNGYGHGVGLSQYGADGMAREGADYKEILTHYYTGTEVY